MQGQELCKGMSSPAFRQWVKTSEEARCKVVVYLQQAANMSLTLTVTVTGTVTDRCSCIVCMGQGQKSKPKVKGSRRVGK